MYKIRNIHSKICSLGAGAHLTWVRKHSTPLQTSKWTEVTETHCPDCCMWHSCSPPSPIFWRWRGRGTSLGGPSWPQAWSSSCLSLLSARDNRHAALSDTVQECSRLRRFLSACEETKKPTQSCGLGSSKLRNCSWIKLLCSPMGGGPSECTWEYSSQQAIFCSWGFAEKHVFCHLWLVCHSLPCDRDTLLCDSYPSDYKLFDALRKLATAWDFSPAHPSAPSSWSHCSRVESIAHSSVSVWQKTLHIHWANFLPTYQILSSLKMSERLKKWGWETDYKNHRNRKDLQGIRKQITFIMMRKIITAENHEDVCRILYTPCLYRRVSMPHRNISKCKIYSKHRILLT